MKEMMMKIKGIKIIINTPSQAARSEINLPAGSYIQICPMYDYEEEITVEEQVEINERLAEQDEAGLQTEHPKDEPSSFTGYPPNDDAWLNKVCGNDQQLPPPTGNQREDSSFNDVNRLHDPFLDRSRR